MVNVSSKPDSQVAYHSGSVQYAEEIPDHDAAMDVDDDGRLCDATKFGRRKVLWKACIHN